jgi:hypothetical protein
MVSEVESSRMWWRWVALVAVLLAVRLPSIVQPAGGDQGLYGYAGQRMLAGDVMYRDMWDQKPPAIAFVYAVLWRVWPSDSAVPAADLVVAATVAFLLFVLGERLYSRNVGGAAAVLFLLLGDPYLQRLSGIYVRGQCEPFVALAVTVSLVLLSRRTESPLRPIGAGIALAAAFWLKYNALAYGLPAATAVWVMRADNRDRVIRDLLWIGAAFAAVGVVVVTYFAVNAAFTDLRLATIDYNLHYSGETYESRLSVLRYLIVMPLERARIDMIWFVGGLGAVLLAGRLRSTRSTAIVFAWLAATVISIAINGSRSLPNYFVQANPALALAGAAGLATLDGYGLWVRSAAAILLAGALWRVGSDTPVWHLRLASMPGLVENVRYDLAYVRGRIDRDHYLDRFSGQKHDALEIEQLVRYVREMTQPDEPIFVFGFSGGSVCWKSQRVSSSRFFWSRPVIVEFASDRPGYGSAGLLADLRHRPPAVLVLQKEEWRSYDFFMSTPPLRQWLEAGYTLHHETQMFSVWRRVNR